MDYEKLLSTGLVALVASLGVNWFNKSAERWALEDPVVAPNGYLEARYHRGYIYFVWAGTTFFFAIGLAATIQEVVRGTQITTSEYFLYLGPGIVSTVFSLLMSFSRIQWDIYNLWECEIFGVKEYKWDDLVEATESEGWGLRLKFANRSKFTIPIGFVGKRKLFDDAQSVLRSRK